MKRLAIVAALLTASGSAFADGSREDQWQLLVLPRFFELRLAAGLSLDNGGASPTEARPGFLGTGRVDVATIDAVGVKAWAFRVEAGGHTPTEGVVSLGLFSIDTLMIGSHSTLDGSQPCFTYVNEPCSRGYVGVGLDVAHYQLSTTNDRNVFRVGELTGVLAFEPVYGTSSGGSGGQSTWLAHHFPIRLGASLDYVYGGPVTNTFVGRFVAGIDGVVRFANGHGELEARFRYRPSFTAWVDDFGIESSLYIGYGGEYRLLQTAGTLWHVGLEIGYGYWSLPEHSFGIPWDEVGKHTAFARLVFQPATVTLR